MTYHQYSAIFFIMIPKQEMLVIIDRKQEIRQIDRYEIDITDSDIPQIPLAVPKMRQNEELLRTIDGKVIIAKI